MSGSEQELVQALRQDRLLVAALALAALWTAESVAPMFTGRCRRVSHGAANLALAGLNAAVTAAFAFGLLAVTEAARANGFGLLHWLRLPAPLEWAAALVLFDAWQYGWHRLNHRLPFLWRFHAVHHADAELDASSGVRFHTAEIALSFAARLAVAPLLGLTVPQLLLYELIALPVILFHHANLRLPERADHALRWLIVTPRMHYVHHSRWQPETDSNYSSLLSVWDRLFGSFRLRDKPQEIALGLDDWQESEWRRLPGMLAAPFRRRTRGGPQGRRGA
ncbi:MAG: sterol desaturase family protein [Limisphaerales bacterium]